MSIINRKQRKQATTSRWATYTLLSGTPVQMVRYFDKDGNQVTKDDPSMSWFSLSLPPGSSDTQMSELDAKGIALLAELGWDKLPTHSLGVGERDNGWYQVNGNKVSRVSA